MTAVQQPARMDALLLGRQRIAARDLIEFEVTDDVTGVRHWRKRKNRFHRMQRAIRRRRRDPMRRVIWFKGEMTSTNKTFRWVEYGPPRAA